MTTLRIIFAALMLLVAATVAQTVAVAAPPVPRITIPGEVVNVVDGDTLDVEFRFVVRFRLVADDGRECWARESKTKDLAEKKLGLAAKEHLKAAALGKRCLTTLPLTSYRLIDYMTMERLLADVWVDGESLGGLQIRTGFASSSKGGKLGE